MSVFSKYITSFPINNNLKQIIFNINWLIFENLVQIASGLVVGVWVARYLGPEGYGIISYAVAFVTIFLTFTDLGLSQIAIKDLVENPNEKSRILGTSFILKTVASISSIILIVPILVVLKPDNFVIQIAVTIVSIKLLIETPNVINYWFQANVNSKYSAISKSLGTLASSIIKIVFILSKFGVIWFLVAIVVESLVATILLIKLYDKKSNENIFLWNFKLSLAKDLLKKSWPLLFAGIAASIYKRIDQLIIGGILDTGNLGIYAAAVTIAEAPYFISTAISNSVYPAVIYSKKFSESLYLKRLQLLYVFVVWLSMFISIFIFIFSKNIILLLYGEKYLASAEVLKVYVWSGIFIFLRSAGNRYLLAENMQKELLISTVVGALVNVVLNIIFIPKLGILGAAYATLVSYIVSTFSIIVFRNARMNVRMYISSFSPTSMLFLLREYKNLLKPK
jgi:O-antigen/teichoic acid export membrane protein